MSDYTGKDAKERKEWIKRAKRFLSQGEIYQFADECRMFERWIDDDFVEHCTIMLLRWIPPKDKKDLKRIRKWAFEYLDRVLDDCETCNRRRWHFKPGPSGTKRQPCDDCAKWRGIRR